MRSPSTQKAAYRHWLSPERVVLMSLPMLAVLGSLAFLWLQHSSHGLRGDTPLVGDFITYWSASSLVLAGRPEAAYDLGQITAVAQTALPGFSRAVSWQYPPTFLLTVWPLALLPLGAAWWVFLGGSFALYVLVVYRTLKPVLDGARLPAHGLAHVVLPLAAFPGVAINLLYGQNGFLTASLMGSGLYLLRRRPLAAGICFGLLAIKPHLALLVPLALLCGRQWRAFAAAALTACSFLVLSVALLGGDSMRGFLVSMARARHWLEAAGSHQRVPVAPQQIDASWIENARLGRNAMPTVFAFLREIDVPMVWAYALHGLVAAAVALFVARAWYREVSWPLRCALLALGSLLVTPYVFDYELAWLVLPVAWMTLQGASGGWQRGDRECLLAVWALPLLLFWLSRAWPLPFAQFLLLGFFVFLARRAERDIRR